MGGRVVKPEVTQTGLTLSPSGEQIAGVGDRLANRARASRLIGGRSYARPIARAVSASLPGTVTGGEHRDPAQT